MSNPFRYFNSSPEVIRLVMMMYVDADEELSSRRGGVAAEARTAPDRAALTKEAEASP